MSLFAIIFTLCVMGVAILYLLRIVLILAGWYKSPILHHMERYGGQEYIFYPLPELIFVIGVIFGGANILMQDFTGTVSVPMNIAGVFGVIAYFAHTQRESAYKYRHIWGYYPRWYRELQANTTRLERRRIAYRWLLLPPKTRLQLNSNDKAFQVWADFIIISTLD